MGIVVVVTVVGVGLVLEVPILRPYVVLTDSSAMTRIGKKNTREIGFIYCSL